MYYEKAITTTHLKCTAPYYSVVGTIFEHDVDWPRQEPDTSSSDKGLLATRPYPIFLMTRRLKIVSILFLF